MLAPSTATLVPTKKNHTVKFVRSSSHPKLISAGAAKRKASEIGNGTTLATTKMVRSISQPSLVVLNEAAEKIEASADYTMDVVQAVRAQDLNQLRQMLENGQSFDVCNSNGEYLIHLACRRANLETIQFLVQEAQVCVNVRDRMGRTILHDVCWRPSCEPEIMSYLMTVVNPMYLILEDVRGHTPFDYSRVSDRPTWNTFLRAHTDLIRRRIGASTA